MTERCEEMKFIFGAAEGSGFRIPAGRVYDREGFGFVTRAAGVRDIRLNIPELNSGFEPACWLQDLEVQEIREDNAGVWSEVRVPYPAQWKIPLVFKTAVPEEGNYRLTVTLSLPQSAEHAQEALVFAGRRQLVFRGMLKPGETKRVTALEHVCPIIPRNHAEEMADRSVKISLVADDVRIREIVVSREEVPTIYIAGDSTVTDQTAFCPYLPEQSYSGWGQMLGCYMEKRFAVSNHAHSGLTTESFRSEGHYRILLDRIGKGDICLFQFGHNDQKLLHLTAAGGYRKNLERYILEIRQKGALPILVTPLARNTWKGDSGAYNDLLWEYDAVCRRIGAEQDVPVAELHEKSMAFITDHGREGARGYFYPSDYTHTNDFGAYLFAGYVADELKRLGAAEKRADVGVWELPKSSRSVEIPAGLEHAQSAREILFRDLERPEEYLTRAEALEMAIETLRFFPINVYNDMFTDVVGHETYAGAVECAWQNGLIPAEMVKENRLYPEREVTGEEFLNILMLGYKSRRPLPENIKSMEGADEWAGMLCAAARALGCVGEGFMPRDRIQRRDAAEICRVLGRITF